MKTAFALVLLFAVHAHAGWTTPIKTSKLPSALAVRGGGIIESELVNKASTGSFALYGLGFLLAPEVISAQNFNDEQTKLSVFTSRILGATILALASLAHGVGYDSDAVTKVMRILVPTIAVLGPATAHIQLSTTQFHTFTAIPLMVTLTAMTLLSL